jgi:predicted DCC family thiol-disulfide oxidoreductase YuxK
MSEQVDNRQSVIGNASDVGSPHSDATTSPIVFFDGVCGLCNRSVDWIIRHDRNAIFRFAPLQGETSRTLLGPDAGADLNTIVLLDEHGQHRRSVAVVAILRRLGGFWRLCGALLWIVPRPIRNWGYNVIARNRYRWFGKHDTCRIPSAAERARFLP